MAADEKEWPLTKEQKCQWCDTALRLTRKGTAPEYHKGFSAPKRGTGYYYTSEMHHCPKRDEIGKALKKTQDGMERAIFGGKK